VISRMEVNGLTVVMYHYIRDFNNSYYPRINGLEFKDFVGQIKFLIKNYEIIEYKALVDHILFGDPLPKNACLLTFDDGYADHFEFALQVLEVNGLKGVFFPPVDAIMEGRVLSVNKIHYLLAVNQNVDSLVREIEDVFTKTYGTVEQFRSYVEGIDVGSRFDPPKVILIKRLLQKVLPRNCRDSILDSLFLKYVSSDERSFAETLYMSKKQLSQISSLGHTVGIHTKTHPWMETLELGEQCEEIVESRNFIESISAGKDWAIAYPYGSYNSDTLKAVGDNGGIVGFTTEPALDNLPIKNPLEIPRLDTNDLPFC